MSNVSPASYNTLAVAVVAYTGLASIIGILLAGENLFMKFDDLAIIGLAIIGVVWIAAGNWNKVSAVPLALSGVTMFIILQAFIVEALTESAYDEIITLPILVITTIIVGVGYMKTSGVSTGSVIST